MTFPEYMASLGLHPMPDDGELSCCAHVFSATHDQIAEIVTLMGMTHYVPRCGFERFSLAKRADVREAVN